MSGILFDNRSTRSDLKQFAEIALAGASVLMNAICGVLWIVFLALGRMSRLAEQNSDFKL